jgi:thiol-disulfide isomerase/thioredoxin
MPSVNSLYEKLKGNKNVVFIMVDADNDFSKSASFMSKHEFSLPVYQVNGTMPSTLFSGTLPTTVIIDKTGKIVFRHEGVADYGNAKILAYLQELSK